MKIITMFLVVISLLFISCSNKSEVTFQLSNDLNLPMNQTTTIVLENHNGAHANVYTGETETNTFTFIDFPKGTYTVKIKNKSFDDLTIASLIVKSPKMTQAVNLTTKVGSIITMAGIEWRILEKQPNKVLLITQSLISYRSYDSINSDWERSEIRRILNGDFFNNAPDQAKARIAETQVNTNGNNTTDKVFLLSTDEARKYFSSDADRIARNQDGSGVWWWLRSPGNNGNIAAGVYGGGGIYMDSSYVYFTSGGVRPALWLKL